jgi:hypothetical protein
MFSYVDLVRVQISLKAEERFAATIPDEEIDNWVTLGDVARSVAERADTMVTESDVINWVRTLLVEGCGAEELAQVGPESDIFSDYDRATSWFFSLGQNERVGTPIQPRTIPYYCAYNPPSDLKTIPSAWRTETVVLLSRQMLASADFSALPLLANALQDAGCDSEVLLHHCRDQKATQTRGCWVVDLVLGEGRYRAEAGER